MKIGQHQGFRADKEGSLGYVFPTITSNNKTVIQKVNDFRQALNAVWMKHYPMKNSFQVKEK